MIQWNVYHIFYLTLHCALYFLRYSKMYHTQTFKFLFDIIRLFFEKPYPTLPWSVSCTILYTAVSTLHSRTMSIVFITASSTLYNNWSVQWKYDLERSIPQIINPLHQPLRCLCTEQCTVQHTVYFAVFYTVQYTIIDQYSENMTWREAFLK